MMGCQGDLTFVVELQLRVGSDNCGKQASLRVVCFKIGGHFQLQNGKLWKTEIMFV